MGVLCEEINQPVLFVIKVRRDGHISVKYDRRIFFVSSLGNRACSPLP